MGNPRREHSSMFSLLRYLFARCSVLAFVLPVTTAEDALLGGRPKKAAAAVAGKKGGKGGSASAGASSIVEWNSAKTGMNVPDCGPMGGHCAIMEAEEEGTHHPVKYY